MDRRINYRTRAFDELKARRPYPKGSLDWECHNATAWKYLQMSMDKPVIDWTDFPPPVTVTRPAIMTQRNAA